jgi:hypothetical protein
MRAALSVELTEQILCTTLNQQNAQYSSLWHITTESIAATCFDPQGIVIREQVSNNIV